MADLVIRGGTVIDGTGKPRRRADVAIEGDRIAAIGSNLTGARTLDASGCVVAPGFIDIHTHYDAQVSSWARRRCRRVGSRSRSPRPRSMACSWTSAWPSWRSSVA